MAAEVAGEVVIVRTEIDEPTHSLRIEHETAQIKIAVIRLVVPGFEAEEERVAVVPRAAHRNDLRVAKILVEGKRGVGIGELTVEP